MSWFESDEVCETCGKNLFVLVDECATPQEIIDKRCRYCEKESDE